MKRLKETTRARLVIAHGLAMTALGLGLLYIRSTMTDLLGFIFGSAFALLLVAASLLFIAVLDWIYAAGLGPHPLSRVRGLLFLSTAAAAGSVVLIFLPGSTIRTLCYFVGVYAFLLSLGKFRLARHWRGAKRQQAIIYSLAGLALIFSVLLLAVAGQDELNALVIIASYSLFIGLQMLLSIYYYQQRRQPAVRTDRSKGGNN